MKISTGFGAHASRTTGLLNHKFPGEPGGLPSIFKDKLRDVVETLGKNHHKFLLGGLCPEILTTIEYSVYWHVFEPFCEKLRLIFEYFLDIIVCN